MHLQQFEMSPTTPPPPNSCLTAFTSLSSSLPPSLLSHSSFDLHPFAPTFFSLATNNIPSSWNFPSSVTKAGKDEGRRSGGNSTLPVVPAWVGLFVYVHTTATVWLWLGRAAVGPHGSMRRITVNNAQWCGSSPLKRQWVISGPSGIESPTSAEWQRYETPLHKRKKIYRLPTEVVEAVSFCMCVNQTDKKREGGRDGSGESSRRA